MTQQNNLNPREISGRLAYTLQQAAEALDVSYTALQNILKKNNIERFRLGYGNTKYVWKDDIDKLLEPRLVGDDEEE